MQSNSDSPFNEMEWVCVSLQAPLGTVILARKLPMVPPVTLPNSAVALSIIRRSGPSNQPNSATKRVRSRRST